jgi:hypothetical protein
MSVICAGVGGCGSPPGPDLFDQSGIVLSGWELFAIVVGVAVISGLVARWVARRETEAALQEFARALRSEGERR